MEYNYKVYTHINKINGKIYVGITCKNLKQRWRNGKGYNGYFSRAIDKYGWDGFEHELIASGLTKQEACNFEILLIKELRSNNSKYGYNISIGGENGRKGTKLSKEARRKMSLSRIGKYSGENNPAWGLKRPDLSKRNLEGRKPVVQYDFDGNFIKEYSSIREAATENNNCKNGIAQSCKGVYIQAYGYFWFFKYGFNQNELNKRISNCKGQKHIKVFKYDLKNNLICEYNTMKEASNREGVDPKTISSYCKSGKVFKSNYILKLE